MTNFCKFLKASIPAAICAALLPGCGQSPTLPPEAEGKVVVVATIFPLADWARRIGGDRVYVETLLPSGASPHTFEPSPREMRLISHASVFLKAGLNMDNYGAQLTDAAADDGLRVVSVGDSLASQGHLPDVEDALAAPETLAQEEAHDGHDHEGHHHHHDHSGVNPHFWLDPLVASEAVKLIRDELIQADPDGETAYTQNAAEYLAGLDQLHAEILALLAPVAGGGFVSFHNAYPYMASRYNLRIVAVIEEYAGKTPSEKYLRAVTDRLRELEIETVFSEPQLNPHLAEIIAGEIGGRVDVLDPYGSESTPGRDTYFALMRYNAGKLHESLSR